MEDPLPKRLRAIIKKVSAWPWVTICERSVLGFLVFALLWKGGKSLEATWLLTGLAWLCTYVYWASQKKKSDEDPVPASIWILLMLFIVWTILSFAFSSTKNYGLDEVFRTASLALVFLWTCRFTSGKEGKAFLQNLVKFIVIGTLIAGLIGLFVYIFQPVNRFVGTFFDYRFHTDYWPNAWADWLLIAWPLIALWVVKEKRMIPMLLRSLVLGLVIGFLLLSYSRGAIIAFTGQLVLWLLWTVLIYWKKSSFEWKNVSIRAGMILLTSVFVFSCANIVRSQLFPVQPITEKISFTAAEGSSSVSERSEFWKQSLFLSLKRPVLGWGPYSFRFVQPKLQTSIRATSDHPHNVILKLSMERGIIAAFLFLSILVTILYASVNKISAKPNVPVLGFSLIAVAGLLSHSLIDYNLQFVSISMLLWILLAVLMAESKRKKSIVLNKKIVRTFEVLLASIVLIVAVFEAEGIVISSVGRHLEARGEAERALLWYDKANPQIISRDMHLSRANILYGQKRFAEAQNALDDYMKVNNEDYRGWKIRGDIFRSQREVDSALESYEKALSFGGRFNDFGITRSKTELMIDSERWDDLALVKEDTIGLMKTYVDAVESNTHFIALSPNVEDVIDLANRFSLIYTRRERPMFEVLAARADHHSQVERARIEARSPGYLW
ncbi:MAG: O-antigen ligase family protein [Candidatus Peribacteraceae bacterium]|jgi:O-antigen ligase|nr:O-antigen ligase family protein [Candidatus Peribacteraceae bacterium]